MYIPFVLFLSLSFVPSPTLASPSCARQSRTNSGSCALKCRPRCRGLSAANASNPACNVPLSISTKPASNTIKPSANPNPSQSSFASRMTSSTISTHSVSPKPTSSSHPSNPAPSKSASNPSGGGSSTSQSDIEAYLSAHNKVRALHGAQPLTWSDELASKAQEWSNKCVFKHSGGTLGAFGENLAAGTGDGYFIPQAIKSWTDEVSEYNPSSPTFSHFTQVVWKGSTQLGCAFQECSGIFDASFGPAKFFTCEYFPQGNIVGEAGENVQV